MPDMKICIKRFLVVQKVQHLTGKGRSLVVSQQAVFFFFLLVVRPFTSKNIAPHILQLHSGIVFLSNETCSMTDVSVSISALAQFYVVLHIPEITSNPPFLDVFRSAMRFQH